MTTHQCSREAYQYAQKSLSKRQEKVLWAIKHLKKASNNDLAQFLGLPVHTITPRTGELRDKGLIASVGKKRNRHGRMETLWAAEYSEELF